MWIGPSQSSYWIQSQVCDHKLIIFATIFCMHCHLFRIHAVCVCDDATHFHEAIDAILAKLGLSEDSEGRPAVRSRDIVDIIEGYEGRGYALSTDEELGIAIKRSSMFRSFLNSLFSFLLQLS